MSKKPVMRSCSVCRTKDTKRQLTRLVHTAEGVVIDPTGKLNGRGAYLCAQPACWERALSTDILNKALRTSLTEADRIRLRQATL